MIIFDLIASVVFVISRALMLVSDSIPLSVCHTDCHELKYNEDENKVRICSLYIKKDMKIKDNDL